MASHSEHSPKPQQLPSKPRHIEEPSVGVSGFLRLLLAVVILIVNVGVYTMLPIASLGLLPMLLASICLLSGTFDDLGLNR